VAGATGTGKTVTLQVLAEGFSAAGVPVFAADIKGDLAGIAAPGDGKEAFVKRAKDLGLAYEPDQYPVVFWDLFGEQGHPIRATISQLGALLLSRLMNLSEAQEGVLNIAFKIASDEKLPLIDLKDLQALLEDLAARADTLTTKYGNVTKASVGSIQRSLLVLEQQGGAHFFGEPPLKITDLMRTARDGRGYISVLAADKLMESPRLYATFLLFLLSELFEQLPEVGDPDKPKLVFFFDEAHLLFRDAPKALLQKVEQVVRLIRSKGVGVYFVTQNPLDVPDTVSRQLGNRVQHALRAFTPLEQKAVKAAATTFRKNPKIDTEQAIMQLGIGEALVSTLDEKGQPSMVELTLVHPPHSRVGPITEAERKAIINASPVKGVYDETEDRASAYESLQKRSAEREDEAATRSDEKAAKKSGGGSRSDSFWTTFGKTLVRTGVPLATKVLTDVLKGRTRRGG
jgi:DNA helicase HerA-like ATPase